MKADKERWILRVSFEENAAFQEVGVYHSKEAVLEAKRKITAFKPYATEILLKMNL